ncbi:sporulation protein YpjB [Paenibacillus oceani]|uniref:Sporulation protein n=1 Tax=Paenibacillus oceani TaxID=2772510 RepID=A0A927C7P2_9BACL|nr:sporulation protein YpjB [Paenibacillus oceani]MBD2861261.1 sporulation protein [Paenibacillus oceani]
MFVFGKKRIGAVILIPLLGIALLTGCGKEKPAGPGQTATAEQLRQVERLNDTADEMYRFIMDGNIDKARDKLDEVGNKMTQIRFDGITSVEGVGALSNAIVQAKRSFQAVNVSEEEVKGAAAKIRLATDALTHANQPMWLQYYKSMKETARQLEAAVQKKDKQEASAKLDQLHERYEIIRPSLLISRQPFEVEKVDSLFAFLRSQLSKPELDTKLAGGGIDQFHLTLDALFGRQDKAAFIPVDDSPVPLPSVMAIGSVIIAVLAFAAWRIFKFENRY